MKRRGAWIFFVILFLEASGCASSAQRSAAVSDQASRERYLNRAPAQVWTPYPATDACSGLEPRADSSRCHYECVNRVWVQFCN